VTPAAQEPGAPQWLEIVVPARNEASRLPAGLAQLCDKAARLRPGVGILVVDSASTDATPDIVRNWPAGPVPVRMIRVDRAGKGAAVRAGLLATQAPLVGFCDVDMATDLSALDIAVRLLESGQRVVIGSRALEASEVESRHSVLRLWGAAVFRGLAGRLVSGVRDTQCGFKFFAGPVARAAAASLTTTGYAFDIELLARCQALGAEPVEIPVRWKDVPGSTFSAWRHSASTFRDLAQIWLSTRHARRAAGPVLVPAAPALVSRAEPASSAPPVPGSVGGAIGVD
jgi:dolichyl-phosphate beta-glucosyltransferase